MLYLLDANILLRLADPASSQHGLVSDALTELFAQGEELLVSAQAYAENFFLEFDMFFSAGQNKFKLMQSECKDGEPCKQP
jgi:hypothetical protein